MAKWNQGLSLKVKPFEALDVVLPEVLVQATDKEVDRRLDTIGQNMEENMVTTATYPVTNLHYCVKTAHSDDQSEECIVTLRTTDQSLYFRIGF